VIVIKNQNKAKRKNLNCSPNIFNLSSKPHGKFKSYIGAYRKISLYIYFLSLAFIVIGLLFSRGMISIGFISFSANWLIEGGYKEKWQTFKSNKAFAIISLIFALHLLGLIHTENTSSGLSEIKVKLPLLLPIFYFSSRKLLGTINPHYFIYLFIVSTITASVYGFAKFELFSNYSTVEDLNNIALVGQNIRLSLFINLSIFGLIYYLLKRNHKKAFKGLLILAVIWLILFLYILNSLTGHITFIFLLVFSLFFIFKRNKKLIISLIGFLIIGAITFTLYLNKVYNNFHKIESIDLGTLEEKTVNGNIYYHNPASIRVENGYYIDIYICKQELEKGWGKVSELTFSGKDSKGHNLIQTIIRYLSSKGLRKDSVGFSQLKKEDIQFIENGCANHKYTNKYSLKARIYNILWQLNTYEQSGNATAQSVSQRIEFLKVAKLIILKNFWFGVGPGDVMNDFSSELKKSGSKLNLKHHNRVHNQYIVEFVAFGIFGLIAFLYLSFYPIFKFRIWKNYLFSSFYLIILLSYLTDNTLDTQLGNSFFSIFYCLLCFDFSKTN